MVKKESVKPVQGLPDKKLEDALNEWYTKGFATWAEKGATGEDGVWGGSLHYLRAERKSGMRVLVSIDFGSIEKRGSAFGELQKSITNSGYEISSGKIHNGYFYIIPSSN